MEKQKRWQFYLIVTVILLTLYNILPTIFFYSKPLKSPIDASKAQEISYDILDRVNSLEEDAIAWIGSFSNLLGVTPTSIIVKKENPGLVEITFTNTKDAEVFKQYLPRAGTLIPFVPAQLELYPQFNKINPNQVLVARQIDLRFNSDEAQKLFKFSPKNEADGSLSNLYREVVEDRVETLALALTGPSRQALQLAMVIENAKEPQLDEMAIALAKEIVEVENALGKGSPIAKRYYGTFTQINLPNKEKFPEQFISRLEALKARWKSEGEELAKKHKGLLEKGELVNVSEEEQIQRFETESKTLSAAISIIKKNLADFKSGNKPLTENEVQKSLQSAYAKVSATQKLQAISLKGRNPYFQSIAIDWGSERIHFNLYPDVLEKLRLQAATELSTYSKDKLNQLVMNDMAQAARIADETITPEGESFSIALNQLAGGNSFLTLDLGAIAQKRATQLENLLLTEWKPTHADLSHETYPVLSYETFNSLPEIEKKLGLVIYAPGAFKETPPAGFRKGSVYVIAKGLESVIEKAQENPQSPESRQLAKEINQLTSLLGKDGFIAYTGATYGIDPAFRKDYIFELSDFYSTLLKATREDFTVKGSKRYATLDFTDVEQRILTLNKIEDRIQEDLLKWKEEYNVSQVDINTANKYLVPAPTKNTYWQNFKLSLKKYFRGDERKVIKWGLDLSGGKTVRIGLRDHNNRPVTAPEDLRQAVNELYTRINTMGVSERTIRIEGNNIILDFPGSQNFSASDLIQASSMHFHIVNEKFAPSNTALRQPVTQFLQEVWNEAVVTNRKDVESINLIAWKHLGGDSTEPAQLRPISESARELYQNGLRLANPKEVTSSQAFNDTLSSIAIMRGDEFTQWEGQSNPLLIVFNNYALNGSSLTNVQVGYDPSQGNILSFNVKSSYADGQSGDPRDDFYTWTSQFAEKQIIGTPKEAITKGRGWRMAVILNDKVITWPALRAELRDGGTISGHFSQREISRLAADLKAGSLTFVPQILSEENVSPELGQEERFQGILAAFLALILVVAAMVSYYHFAGVVASCAVLLNILIMWGVLQNLGAALSLPTIAGIVLTIGMAVDANVLVFERIREEFKLTGRIASAIQAGYRKAFSAIVDSNITTIIAAFILIQFDSGPIKGFAVSLIVGILSSMFTALFMTRYFFAGWVQNPNNKTLTMSQFIGNTNFDFLSYAKKAIIASLVVILLGSGFFVAERKTLFGMDFTGGYSLNIELVEQQNQETYRRRAIDALLAAGATTNDILVRERSKPNQLRIQLGMGMEEKGHPFYQMPEVVKEGNEGFEYQKNPRIVWVVEALEKAQLKIVPNQMNTLNENWTVISGQLSDTMRNNAIVALLLALLSILIYITFRFEFKFAIAAVVGLVHDVLITLGLLAMFHALGWMVQIDLQVIGAIMTIIGYSLNDTIIVFDRIREDMHSMRKSTFPQIINHALNVTLSRTIMTSGTTLLVLLCLVFLGGQSIFSFALVMTLGVLVGTASSLFIASPVLLYFHNKEQEKSMPKAINHKA